jgi:Leucine-rich repeat (LRR) protein
MTSKRVAASHPASTRCPRARSGSRARIWQPIILGPWTIALFASACQEGGTIQPEDNPPVTSAAIPAQTVHVGETVTVDLSRHFSDPDGDALTFTATTSDAGVTTVSVSGSIATVAGVSQGDATVTATAHDGTGQSAQQSFAVNIPNRPPLPVGNIADLELSSQDTVMIDVSGYFTDPDGDILTYAVEISDESVAMGTVTGETVTVVAVSDGTISVAVTASDGGGLSAEQSFSATVELRGDPRVEFFTASVAAREGAVAVLEFDAQPAPRSTLEVGYTIGADDDPATADADEADHDGGSGSTVQIPAGANRATIRVTVHDDSDIEATRELLTISLNPPENGAGYTLGASAIAVLTIEEGVCDRTQQVRDAIVALTQEEGCHRPDDADLATIDTLNLGRPTPTEEDAGQAAQRSLRSRSAVCAQEHGPVLQGSVEPPPTMSSRCSSGAFEPPLSPPALPNQSASEAITALRAKDFSGLTGLRSLWLSANELTELPDGIFSGLRQLQTIGLGWNRLRVLQSDLLSDLVRLERFSIHQNELTRLPADLFAGRSRLTELWVSDNHLTSLPAGIFSDLTDLETLVLTINRLEELPTGVFSGLSDLRTLSLGSNRLVDLQGGAFSDLTSLEELRLGDNRLTRLPPELFSNLGSLRFLDLIENRIEELEDAAFSSLSELRQLWITDNHISTLKPGVFSGLSGLDTLSLWNNRIHDVEPGVFTALTNLKMLDLGGNQLGELKRDVFTGLNHLDELWLIDAALSRLDPGVLNGLPRLRKLVMPKNRLDALADGVFTGLPLLEELVLYQSGIGELSADAFAELPRLRKLSLLGNRLVTMPPGAFSNLVRLESLWLGQNQLQRLPPDVFSDLAALQALQLQDNRIPELAPGIFKGLSDLVEFNVENNPGAPFTLSVRLERKDTLDVSAPGPANVVATIAEGAPFTMTIPLSVLRGTISTETVVIERGQTTSAEFTVTLSSSSQTGTQVFAGPAPPVAQMIHGIDVVAADTLTLFTVSADAAGAAPDMAGREGTGPPTAQAIPPVRMRSPRRRTVANRRDPQKVN